MEKNNISVSFLNLFIRLEEIKRVKNRKACNLLNILCLQPYQHKNEKLFKENKHYRQSNND